MRLTRACWLHQSDALSIIIDIIKQQPPLFILKVKEELESMLRQNPVFKPEEVSPEDLPSTHNKKIAEIVLNDLMPKN
jgi:hypothetical protein